MSSKEPNPGALKAMTAGIEKADKRAAGEFDGLFGSLPESAATVLKDIAAHLRQYLLDEKRLTEAEVRRLVAETSPRRGFRSVSQRAADEGIRVAVGVLNSIASVVRVRDGQHRWKGEPLSKPDAIALLLAGRDGLNHRRYMRRQRQNAEKGSKVRSENRQHREAGWLPGARLLRAKHPEWSDVKLASEVARAKDVLVSASTIRQALPKHGLSRRS